MPEYNQRRDLAINALKQKLSSGEYTTKDRQLDTFLRGLYGLPRRPKGTEPYGWLVGEGNSESQEERSVYDRALSFVLRWEGGYVYHPNDKGGATNKGITQGTYDAYRSRQGLPLRPVRGLEDNELQEIYRKEYWVLAKCEVIEEKAPSLAIAHFDWAVNAGVGRAIKTLQQVMGVSADGVWGPQTQDALEKIASNELLNAYLHQREKYYRSWGSQGNQKVFLQGWLNRLNDLKEYLA